MVSTWNVDVVMRFYIPHHPASCIPNKHKSTQQTHVVRYSNDGDSNNQSELVGAGDPWIGDGESTLA